MRQVWNVDNVDAAQAGDVLQLLLEALVVTGDDLDGYTHPRSIALGAQTSKAPSSGSKRALKCLSTGGASTMRTPRTLSRMLPR